MSFRWYSTVIFFNDCFFLLILVAANTVQYLLYSLGCKEHKKTDNSKLSSLRLLKKMPIGLIQGPFGPEYFLRKGLSIASSARAHSSMKVKRRIFLDYFGTRPEIASSIWARIELKRSLPKNAMPHHLLWALLFMKVYGTERVMCDMVSTPAVDPYTFRNWTNFFIKELAKLANEEVRTLQQNLR